MIFFFSFWPDLFYFLLICSLCRQGLTCHSQFCIIWWIMNLSYCPLHDTFFLFSSILYSDLFFWFFEKFDQDGYQDLDCFLFVKWKSWYQLFVYFCSTVPSQVSMFIYLSIFTQNVWFLFSDHSFIYHIGYYPLVLVVFHWETKKECIGRKH